MSMENSEPNLINQNNQKWYKNSTITKFVLFPILPLTISGLLSVRYPDEFFLDGINHFYFEIIAVIFDSIIAIYCISRFRVTYDRFFLFLGLGFIASASIDFLHAIVAITSEGQGSFLEYFIPQTWATGRIIDASMLIIAFISYLPHLIEDKNPIKNVNRSLFIPIATIVALVVGSIGFSIFAPLPSVHTDGPLYRPYDVLASLLFCGTLFFYFQKKFHKINDIFFKGLAGYIVISLFAEIIISMSATNFDAPFNVAHILKDIGYMLIVIVLAKSFQQQFQTKMILLDEIKKIEKRKEEFVAMISHELKTPITPIIMWTDTLRNQKVMGKLSKDQLEAVNIISESAGDLRKLVSDIFDSYKLDLKKLLFVTQRIEIEDLMDSVYRLTKPSAEKRQIKLENSTLEIGTMYSDPRRITQVLVNLINNAIEFVASNTGKIEINASIKGDSVSFFVKDNGKGISKEDQKSLFKKFYQVDTSETREHEGSGLGLSICKGIVEGLGGKIDVESNVGKGSVFYFSIPKKRSNEYAKILSSSSSN